MILNSFPNEVATTILNTPLFSTIRNDRVVWFPTKNGIYSVKTAYHLAMNNLVNASHLYEEGDWLLIWKLKAPPRVKLLLWRACRDCIPTRGQLQSRGVICPLQCVLCDRDIENPWHTFITCPLSTEC